MPLTDLPTQPEQEQEQGGAARMRTPRRSVSRSVWATPRTSSRGEKGEERRRRRRCCFIFLLYVLLLLWSVSLTSSGIRLFVFVFLFRTKPFSPKEAC
ncbi:hypothetical protein SRHO_G00219210 [Serrasalmus rhombeus]